MRSLRIDCGSVLAELNADKYNAGDYTNIGDYLDFLGNIERCSYLYQNRPAYVIP